MGLIQKYLAHWEDLCKYCQIFLKSSICKIKMENSNLFSIDAVNSIILWAARLLTATL